MKLYDLAQQYRRFADEMVSEDGEVSADIEALLDGLNDAMAVKVENVCKLVRQFESESLVAQTEAKRLLQKARGRERVVERLKAYLKRRLENLGVTKFSTALFSARIQTNSRPSFSWTGPLDAIPLELSRVTVEFNPTRAYDMWKDGIPLPAEVNVEHGTHLRIG